MVDLPEAAEMAVMLNVLAVSVDAIAVQRGEREKSGRRAEVSKCSETIMQTRIAQTGASSGRAQLGL